MQLKVSQALVIVPLDLLVPLLPGDRIVLWNVYETAASRLCQLESAFFTDDLYKLGETFKCASHSIHAP